MRVANNVVLTLQPSRRLSFALSVAHAIAIAVLFATTLPTALKAALAACIAVSLVRSLRRHALLRARSSILSMRVLNDGALFLKRRQGESVRATVLGTSYVSASLTVLNLRIIGRRLVEHVVIVPDNIDPEAFRQLRVLLRWRPRAAE